MPRHSGSSRTQVPPGLQSHSQYGNLQNQNIPKDYVVVDFVGNGCTSQAYLCLPTSALIAAKASTLEGKPLMDLAKSELVVIKALLTAWVSSESNHETSMLRAIRDKLALSHGVNRFQEIVASDPMFDINAECRWIATKPVMGSVSLSTIDSLYQRFQARMPEEFILHVFVQINEALGFLRNSFSPSIVHRDLHFGNVLLDFEHQDTPGFPNVVVIDFGHASYVDPELQSLSIEPGTYQDSSLFFDSLFNMTITGAECTCSEEMRSSDFSACRGKCDIAHVAGWPDFWMSFAEAARRKPKSTEEMWCRADQLAKAAVAGADKKVFDEIKEIVLDLIERKISALDIRLEEILRP